MPLLLWAALLWPASAASAFDSARLQRSLEHGLWNDRILAVYELGEQGPAALPLLRCAADDSDWQVRLAAVHFLGKIGAEALPALDHVARREPCFHVRADALESLKGLGEPGREALARIMTPEDERDMAQVPRVAGKPSAALGRAITIDTPDRMTASFFNGGDDMRACSSAERFEAMKPHLCDGPAMYEPREQTAAAESPRAAGAVAAPSAAPAPAAPRASRPAPIEPAPPRPPDEIDHLLAQQLPDGEPVPAHVPAAGRAELAAAPDRPAPEPELSSPLGRPETLPPGEAVPRHETEPAEAALASPPGRALLAGEVRRPLGPRETLAPGQAAPAHEGPEGADARLERDAGTGKQETDPVPVLIEQLASDNARRRARAADELGKRGAKARPALPALRKTLADPDRRARASAALALGSIGAADRGVLKDLRRALRDKDEDVRLSARIALGRLRR